MQLNTKHVKESKDFCHLTVLCQSFILAKNKQLAAFVECHKHMYSNLIDAILTVKHENAIVIQSVWKFLSCVLGVHPVRGLQ